jgi:hypothetical protein
LREVVTGDGQRIAEELIHFADESGHRYRAPLADMLSGRFGGFVFRGIPSTSALRRLPIV